MKKILAILAMTAVLTACNNGAESEKVSNADTVKNEAADALKAMEAANDTLKNGADSLTPSPKKLPDSLTK